MAILSTAEFAAIRAALAVVYVHTFTRTPYSASTEDAHGNVTSTAGTPVLNLPCQYEVSGLVSGNRLLRNESGIVEVGRPTLTVPWDDPIAVGDRVSNVRDQQGVVLMAGPAAVDLIDPNAGIGASLQKVAALLVSDVRRSG